MTRSYPRLQAAWRHVKGLGLLLAAACEIMSGCTTTPPPNPRLDTELSSKFSGVADGGSGAVDAQWWANFGDEELSRLVDQALSNNLDVRLALERVKAAQSGVTAQSSQLFPSLDAQIGTERASSNLPASIKAAQPDILGYQAGLKVSWEFDLSGAIRAARNAAKSDLVTAEAGVVGARLEVASEVARQYFLYRSAERRLALLEALTRSQRLSAKFVAHRVEQGISSSYELDLANSDAAALEAQIPALRTLCASTQAGVATLIGANPSQPPISPSADYKWPSVLAISAGQPTDLLRRRPDLLAAEAKFSAETFRAHEAHDQVWPKLLLSAVFGNEGLTLNGLALSPAHYQNLAAAFAMPIFNSGRITALAEGQDAVARQTLLQWQHSVLIAVQEVESSLALKNGEDARSQSVQEEVLRRRSAVQHAQSLVREGQVDRLTLLQVERAELAGEIDSTESSEQRVLSYVQLYKALGGGWSSGEHTASTETAVSLNEGNTRNPK